MPRKLFWMTWTFYVVIIVDYSHEYTLDYTVIWKNHLMNLHTTFYENLKILCSCVFSNSIERHVFTKVTNIDA